MRFAHRGIGVIASDYVPLMNIEGSDRPQSQPTRPICRLCRQPADRMTDEDVVPKWLRKHLVESHGVSSQAEREEWARLVRTVRTRVCETCNRRMNLAFEAPARPLILAMLEHEPLRLSTEQQLVVARWMMKVTLLWGLMRHWRDDVESAVHPRYADTYDAAASAERQRQDVMNLIETGEMPPGTTIAALAIVATTTERPLLPRTDGKYAGAGHTNFFTMVFEVVQRDAIASRHRTERRADSRWQLVWPPRPGDRFTWPPKRATSIVEMVRYQEVAARQSSFMTMGPNTAETQPSALREMMEAGLRRRQDRQ